MFKRKESKSKTNISHRDIFTIYVLLCTCISRDTTILLEYCWRQTEYK